MQKSGSVTKSYLLGSIYIPNFRKFYQTVPEIIGHGRTNELTDKVESLRFATSDQLKFFTKPVAES